jgi:predicted porin
MLGVSVPLFGGSLLASYQTFDADNKTRTSTVNAQLVTSQYEPDYNIWGIGYTYPFSRRTNLYVAYGQREWDGTVTQNLFGNAALGQASQVVDQSGFALGIRHLF